MNHNIISLAGVGISFAGVAAASAGATYGLVLAGIGLGMCAAIAVLIFFPGKP